MRAMPTLIAFVLLTGCATRAAVEHHPMIEDTQGRLPFSDVVRAGNLLFQSGKLGIAAGTLKLVPGGIKAETQRTMEQIRDSFARHGVSMEQVVKCTVFLKDMAEWGKMNEVYVTFFPTHKPARSALGVSGLALNARVEIECIAAA